MPSMKQVAFIHFQTSRDRNRARSRHPTLEHISVSMRALIYFQARLMTGISRTRLAATPRRVPSRQTLHHRYCYFRLQKKPEVLMQSAPTEKWPVHHVWDLNRGSTTIRTGDSSVEETPESAYTRNDVMNNIQVPTKSNGIKGKFPSVVNTLSTLNVHSKSVRKPNVPTPTSPPLSRRAKCSKNKDDNTHFRIQETSRDIPLQNCQQPKTLSSERRKKQSIAQRNNPYTLEMAERCEKSVLQCEKTLAMMNELLRTSRIRELLAAMEPTGNGSPH